MIIAGSGVLFYVANLETVPESGRRRFRCFSTESAETMGDMTYQQILQQAVASGALLPASDPRTRKVAKVLARLIEGGNLGPGHSEAAFGPESGWKVHVIDDPSQANAFVLPGGKVFVFSGILPICRTEAGLAAVLGHEIAHNIANHAAEKMSKEILLFPVMIGFFILDFMTFGGTGIGRILGNVFVQFGISAPSSRAQEAEADQIGLMLMAKSCYDPEAAVGMWERMEQMGHGQPPEWTSTHPSNRNRIKALSGLMEEAKQKFEEAGCAQIEPFKAGFADVISRPVFSGW
jgi:predicted Zn-dependent protease